MKTLVYVSCLWISMSAYRLLGNDLWSTNLLMYFRRSGVIPIFLYAFVPISHWESSWHFSSEQQTPLAVHLPSGTEEQDSPSTSHGVGIWFSRAHAALSPVFMKHPIAAPQQMLGPTHCPRPSGPHRRHSLVVVTSGILSIDLFPPIGQFLMKQAFEQTKAQTRTAKTWLKVWARINVNSISSEL